MYLFVFSPLSNTLATVGLLGGAAALLLIGVWSVRASAGEGAAIGWTGRLRPLVVWAAALPIGVAVVSLVLFLLLSFVLTFLSAVALRYGGLFLG